MNFYDIPEHIDTREYGREIDNYVRRIARYEELVAIYTIGSVSLPGISDIDMICILKEPITNGMKFSALEHSENPRLFLHDVYVVAQEHFEKLQYIIYPSNLKLVYRRPDLMISPPDTQTISNNLRLMYLLDINLMRLRQVFIAKSEGQCNVRNWMTRILSLRHSIDLCKSVGIGLSEETEETNDRLQEFRQMWLAFRRYHFNDFSGLFLKAEKAVQDIFQRALIRFRDMYAPETLDGTLLKIGRDKILFTNGMLPEYSYRGRTRTLICKVPLYLKYHYLGYLGRCEHSYGQEQVNRFRVVSSHGAFLAKNRLHYSMKGNIGFTYMRQLLLDRLKRLLRVGIDR